MDGGNGGSSEEATMIGRMDDAFSFLFLIQRKEAAVCVCVGFSFIKNLISFKLVFLHFFLQIDSFMHSFSLALYINCLT